MLEGIAEIEKTWISRKLPVVNSLDLVPQKDKEVDCKKCYVILYALKNVVGNVLKLLYETKKKVHAPIPK